MYYNTYIKDKKPAKENQAESNKLIDKVHGFLSPLLEKLENKLDKRYVYTFFDLFFGILSFRDRANGLLLSELGGYVNGPKNAPAGTKRISNLLRNKDWSHKDVEEVFSSKMEEKTQDPNQAGKQWLMLWDDGVIEKHESWFSEGLCPVKSSKAGRLTKIKPGYYQKISGRICVPGHEWSAAVLSTRSDDKPQVAAMKWWTTRGKHKEERSNVFYTMLIEMVGILTRLQLCVWHILDRGYANGITLERMFHLKQRFIVRWKYNLLLTNKAGLTKNTFKHAMGCRAVSHKQVWDKERKQPRNVSIAYIPVTHPDFSKKLLYLIIIRDKRKGRQPMYLLTNVAVDTIGMAWEIFFSYMKRWDIEQCFRFGKTAMAMESPRLWFWENRLKLLMIVALLMAFFFELLQKHNLFSIQTINTWCPRTGKRQVNADLPLYRLRLAISQLVLYELNPFYKNKG